jgi:hypothetical protein
MIEFRKALPKLKNFVFTTQNCRGTGFRFGSKLADVLLALRHLGLEQIELMASELGVEVLKFVGNLLVTARLASLPLQRTNLPFDFANQIRNADKVLVGILEFAQSLFLLRFEFGDASRLLKDHAAILRLARQKLCDVPLCHHAITAPTDSCSHEKLLDVFEAARSLVDKVFAGPIPEYPPSHRDLVVP